MAMTSLADFIRDGCSARPEDKYSALAQLAALEACIEALENTVAAKQNIIKCIQGTVNGHLEAEAALAADKPAQPTMYPGSSALREWVDLHGEQGKGS
jgi:hypothetical protein